VEFCSIIKLSWLEADPLFHCMQRTPSTQDLDQIPYLQAAKMSQSVIFFVREGARGSHK